MADMPAFAACTARTSRGRAARCRYTRGHHAGGHPRPTPASFNLPGRGDARGHASSARALGILRSKRTHYCTLCHYPPPPPSPPSLLGRRNAGRGTGRKWQAPPTARAPQPFRGAVAYYHHLMPLRCCLRQLPLWDAPARRRGTGTRRHGAGAGDWPLPGDAGGLHAALPSVRRAKKELGTGQKLCAAEFSCLPALTSLPELLGLSPRWDWTLPRCARTPTPHVSGRGGWRFNCCCMAACARYLSSSPPFPLPLPCPSGASHCCMPFTLKGMQFFAHTWDGRSRLGRQDAWRACKPLRHSGKDCIRLTRLAFQKYYHGSTSRGISGGKMCRSPLCRKQPIPSLQPRLAPLLALLTYAVIFLNNRRRGAGEAEEINRRATGIARKNGARKPAAGRANGVPLPRRCQAGMLHYANLLLAPRSLGNPALPPPTIAHC